MEVELSAEAKDKRINRLVALTVVVLSVATGLGNIKDGNIVQAMAQSQANALDRWNEYQATKTKLHIVETAQAQLGAAVPGLRMEETYAGFRVEADKYKAESPKLAAEAKGFSDDYDALNVHDDQFDAAEASLTTAISIAAVAALTESWMPLVASWLIGGFGLFMTICGFAGWGFHPDILSTLLG
jgi:hypothetical protein